jgi:hypothetical protein
MLILAAVLTLLLALVATAIAAPPECKRKDPGYPNCSALPPPTTVAPGSRGAGYSCAEYVDLNPGSLDLRTPWDTSALDQLTLTGLKSGKAACIDMSSSAGGSLEVTVNSDDSGGNKNSRLVVLVKDSHAGDHCGKAEGEHESALFLELTLGLYGTIKDIPAATTDACGTDFSEVGQDTEPLVIMVLISGKSGAPAAATLKYDEVEQTTGGS